MAIAAVASGARFPEKDRVSGKVSEDTDDRQLFSTGALPGRTAI